MKRRIQALCLALLAVGIAQRTEACFFDFEGLTFFDGPAAIEDYMEDICRSDVEVLHALAGGALIPEPSGRNLYLQNAPALFGVDWFQISFNDVPVAAVSFDWGASWNGFVAWADGDVIFESGPAGGGNGHFGVSFASPVTALRFQDRSSRSPVAIDNLEVVPVPLPCSLLLLFSGLTCLGALPRLLP
jgi:hypothetical protein